MSILTTIKKLLTSKKTSEAELLRWAQTEYGKDWQTAYYQMKNNPGKIPNVRGVYQ